MENQNLKHSLDRLEKLITCVFNDLSSYQDHKESMSNAGFLLEIAFLSGVFLHKDKLICELGSMTFCLFLVSLIWLIFHVFIRWQLNMRKNAALEQNALLELMASLVNKEPTCNDFDSSLKPIEKTRWYKTKNIINNFFPMPLEYAPDGYYKKSYPDIVMLALKKKFKANPYATPADYCISIGSFIIYMFLVMIFI
jgi:hypothetical protein